MASSTTPFGTSILDTTPKEHGLAGHARECGTTKRALAAYAGDRPERRPHARLGTGVEHAWTVTLPVGPETFGDVPRFDPLWLPPHDQVHPGGRVSACLRMAVEKVPSIGGPTPEEPSI